MNSRPKRLKGMALKVYVRLLNGPATNVDLSKICLSYSSRLSDVRKYVKNYGYVVICSYVERGIFSYELRKRISKNVSFVQED